MWPSVLLSLKCSSECMWRGVCSCMSCMWYDSYSTRSDRHYHIAFGADLGAFGGRTAVAPFPWAAKHRSKRKNLSLRRPLSLSGECMSCHTQERVVSQMLTSSYSMNSARVLQKIESISMHTYCCVWRMGSMCRYVKRDIIMGRDLSKKPQLHLQTEELTSMSAHTSCVVRLVGSLKL